MSVSRFACLLARSPTSSFVRGFATSRLGDGDLKGTALIPEDEYNRKAIIYEPSGPAGQYGFDEKAMIGGAVNKIRIWLPTQENWINPLMGWTSGAETASLAYHRMEFDTVDSAKEFLRKQGIPYSVEPSPTNWDPTYRPKCFLGYGDNFSTNKKGIPDSSYLDRTGAKVAKPAVKAAVKK